MTQGLIRKQQRGDLHFVTFSCYQRQAYLDSSTARALFEDALEKMRVRYGFLVVGYVVMPEHVHLLMSEPETGLMSTALKSLKLSVALRSLERPFWSARYYDFNVFTEKKRIEKLKYIHRNPVRRGLVKAPEDWVWSSFLHYATGVVGTVEIESEWTASRRDRALAETHVRESGHGAPDMGPPPVDSVSDRRSTFYGMKGDRSMKGSFYD